jgi:uncharacterized protein (DUF2249 family)
MSELDVREIPPNERHDRIHDAFADLEPGESLTIVNDHDPKPLYYELSAEVPAFDDEAYAVEREGPERFVAELPKAEGGAEPETVRIRDLDGEPHGRSPAPSRRPSGSRWTPASPSRSTTTPTGRCCSTRSRAPSTWRSTARPTASRPANCSASRASGR